VNFMGHQNCPQDNAAVYDLVKMLSREADGCPTLVEVGAWAGATTRILACFYGRVFAVDHWAGSEGDRMKELAEEYGQVQAYSTFLANMGDLMYRKVFPLAGPSAFYAKNWPAHVPIDMVFIDAEHTHEAALQDITLWSPHVRPGGIISGHDYCDVFPGVIRAVNETGPHTLAGLSVWWRRKE